MAGIDHCVQRDIAGAIGKGRVVASDAGRRVRATLAFGKVAGPFRRPIQIGARKAGETATLADIGADAATGVKTDFAQLVAGFKGVKECLARRAFGDEAVQLMLVDGSGSVFGQCGERQKTGEKQVVSKSHLEILSF
ncbi:MAG: hypothetical protein IPM89_00075 [Candidatus Competibacteraceae bacterium]|nr:MAG: hypothetical protein IPM89_00075 [Candidatus Competibacteraceae bacterium]